MANTRTSTKRARQSVQRQARNQMIRSQAKSALRSAIEAIGAKDVSGAKTAYLSAVKALSKAATKGAIPNARAARKISRLTLYTKKTLPATLTE